MNRLDDRQIKTDDVVKWQSLWTRCAKTMDE